MRPGLGTLGRRGAPAVDSVSDRSSPELLIIRHDITPQKFHPNNPSISPQLANLNVLEPILCFIEIEDFL